ncbi:hypothetical protein T02_5256 [Trichinella nativa]|uniref:Uncharacterized protein n=1 Tax=Trichinella nativa TaxID=6335 RepID=A0A0V1KS69_9BILA|nr:hypothetical protein T02_5256 [Trichinella nativa]
MLSPLADAGGVQHHVLPIPGYAGGGAPCAAPRNIDALTDMHVDDLVKSWNKTSKLVHRLIELMRTGAFPLKK